MILLRSKKFILMAVIFILALHPGFSQAKGGDEQNQIILLNDSAAALEDSHPGLSKSLAQLADEKEKLWEVRNADKNAAPAPLTAKNIKQLRGQIKLLKAAALAIGPAYPLIVQGLKKMANDINKTIEITK